MSRYSYWNIIASPFIKSYVDERSNIFWHIYCIYSFASEGMYFRVNKWFPPISRYLRPEHRSRSATLQVLREKRSLKQRTRIINYHGQPDERSMREQALSFSISVLEKLVPTERTGENEHVTRNNCKNVCGCSKEIDSARRNVAFDLGKCRRLYILSAKSVRSRNDSIKKSSDTMPITAKLNIVISISMYYNMSRPLQSTRFAEIWRALLYSPRIFLAIRTN